MHYPTKTSKLANLVLAIGLTIVTQLPALGPDRAARMALPTPPPAATCAQAGPATLVSATGVQAVAAAGQPAVCDRCRAICARNCASYACIACAKSIKCGLTVQACVSTRRKT